MLKTKISGSIVAGNIQTNPIITNEYTLAGFIVTGSVITGSQVGFLVSTDNVTYYPLFDSVTGNEVLVSVTGSPRAYDINRELFESWGYLKLRLGSSGSPVAQATYDLGLAFIAASY